MKNFKKILYWVFAPICIWIGISSTIQRFKCTKLTETELFIKIPNTFVGDWSNCN